MPNSHTEHDLEPAPAASPEETVDESALRRRTALNWALAVLTLPGALLVVVFQYMQVLGSAGCSDQVCPRLGPGPAMFGLIEYGAPAVALICIAVSAFTAKRRNGILVPAAAWALLVLAFAILVFSFQTP